MGTTRIPVFFLLLLSACGGGDPAGDCDADADCGDARVCSAGSCVECAADDDSASGRCAANVCVDCTSDGDCGPRFACDDGTCALLTDCVVGVVAADCAPCAADAECFAGERCQAGACVAACEATADPERYCLATSLAGSRAPGCQLDYLDVGLPFCDGPGPQSLAPDCDPCLASLGGCPGACTDGYCDCTTTSDCPAGRVCSEGRCDARICREDTECPCDAYCDGERCRAYCDTDADCPTGRCEPESGRCVPCLEDSDCDGAARCYADGCVVPCQSDAVCDGNCTESGRCQGCSAFELGPRVTPRRNCD